MVNMSLVTLPGPKIKTPSVHTLGVLLFGLLHTLCSLSTFGDCMPAGTGEIATIDRVLDGDTVKLTDGRHLRVLGINTPEVNHGIDRSGQALGEESKREAEDFFSSDKRVRLFYDVERLDPYKRTLAHVYDLEGNSLSAHLLKKGLGFHVAIPPNLSLNDCLFAQERGARKKSLGVWSHPEWRPIPAANLSLTDIGFKRVIGRIESVRKTQSVWLELDGPLIIKISARDLKNFSVRDWKAWKGRHIEVRGWFKEYNEEERGGRKTKSGTIKKSNKSLIVHPRIAANLDLLDAH
jgi:endonuclease YncB( thermonuclease family)